MGFVSNHLKAFRLEMIVQGPMSATNPSNYLLLGAPGSETLNMSVRRICCLNSLGTTHLPTRKCLQNESDVPFPSAAIFS